MNEVIHDVIKCMNEIFNDSFIFEALTFPQAYELISCTSLELLWTTGIIFKLKGITDEKWITSKLFAPWYIVYIWRTFWDCSTLTCFTQKPHYYDLLLFFFNSFRWKRKKRTYVRLNRRSWIFHHLNRQLCEC